jgi:hypothetical protein
MTANLADTYQALYFHMCGVAEHKDQEILSLREEVARLRGEIAATDKCVASMSEDNVRMIVREYLNAIGLSVPPALPPADK